MTDLIAEHQSAEKAARIKNNINTIDVDVFFDICQRHEVTSIVYKPLEKFSENILPEKWKREYLKVRDQIAFMLEMTRRVCEKLAESNIELIALKNGGIAIQLIDDPALCPMGDIDTLVSKRDFIKAHAIILGMGFNFKFRSDYEEEDIEKAFFDGGTEYFYVNEKGQTMWLELAHRAISGRWIRLDKEPKTDLLFENSQLVPNTFVRVLSPEDNLLQVSIHTAKHSYVREPGFRLHQDVDRIVSRLNIDWALFMHKVNEVGCKTAVYFSLYYAKELFDTAIPEAVLIALKPAKIREKFITHMIAKAGIMEPVEKKFSRPGFVIFQLSLYDGLGDILRVIYPSTSWLKDKYGFTHSFLIPFYVLIRILDLVGIRLKKD
jgi:hypothetical protein